MRPSTEWFALLLAISLAVPFASCKKKRSEPAPAGSNPVAVTPAPISAAVFGPIERWPEGAIYDRDPEHAYNRVFRGLYGRKVAGSISRCLVEPDAGGCMGATPMTPFGGAMVAADIDLGGDEPTLFLGGDADFLGEPGRVRQIEAAIEAARRVPAAENPSRTVLFASDLWERYDALSLILKNEQPANRGGLELVRKKIGELMTTLALPAETIRKIASNRAEIAASNADLLPGFATSDGWIELSSNFNERGPAEPTHVGTRHSEVFGRRFVFRVLVRVPPEAGGPDWLRSEIGKGSSIVTPVGTRLALVASPLAIAAGGELVEVPLVQLVEIRIARQPGVPIASIADAGFEVLEGKRALLVRDERPRGGLERLAPDARLPFGASCSPSIKMLVPLRTTCATCHGPDGARITGPMAHGSLRFEEEKDPNRAAEVVIRAKRDEPAFGELRAGYGG